MQRVVAKVLDKSPASIRALARESGVPHATLVRVGWGEFDLSRQASRKVVRALRRWAATCSDLADSLESADERRGRR